MRAGLPLHATDKKDSTSRTTTAPCSDSPPDTAALAAAGPAVGRRHQDSKTNWDLSGTYALDKARQPVLCAGGRRLSAPAACRGAARSATNRSLIPRRNVVRGRRQGRPARTVARGSRSASSLSGEGPALHSGGRRVSSNHLLNAKKAGRPGLRARQPGLTSPTTCWTRWAWATTDDQDQGSESARSQCCGAVHGDQTRAPPAARR